QDQPIAGQPLRVGSHFRRNGHRRRRGKRRPSHAKLGYPLVHSPAEELPGRNLLNWLRPIQEKGYVIIPGILTPQEITVLTEEFSRADLPRSRAGLRHAMKLPAVAAVAQDPRLMEIASAVLGVNAFPFRATLSGRPPTAHWLVVWHQDTALPLQERHETPGWGPWSVKDGVIYAHAPENALSQVLALRLHLDDSTEENGPLRVLPKTHTLGVLSDEELHTPS